MNDTISSLTFMKDYLLQHGWQQGSYGNSINGPRCISGVCYLVSNSLEAAYALGDTLKTDNLI